MLIFGITFLLNAFEPISCEMGGIQKIGLFGKRPSPYYGKNSSNKQKETTVHHYFKTWRSVNPEHFSAIEETGSHEDHHRKGRPIVNSAAEDKFIRVINHRKCSTNKCFTDFK